MRGRKPKPTHLRLLEGNRGRRPLNSNEPHPIGDLMAAPETFTDSQRAIWDYAIANAPTGLLKLLDRDTLTAWAVAADMHRTAREQQAKLDAGTALPLLTKSPTGQAIQSPYLPIINRQATLMHKFAAELGFTPSSRSRISVASEVQQDPAERFFA